MKILAVDDEPLFIDLLVGHLAELGFKDVETALSGPEALEKIDKATVPYDCFLLDIRMIPMDGIELVREIRALPDYSKAPIIMISVLSDKHSIDRAFLTGANDYVTKPLDPVELNIRLTMASSIIYERRQVQKLYERMQQSETNRLEGFEFEMALPIDDVDAAVPVGSMENYLLKQGNLRLRKSCAIGFHVPNAESYFHSMEPMGYCDLVADLAEVISGALSWTPHLISYLGSGDFVAVLPEVSTVDAGQLFDDIDELVRGMSDRYAYMDMTFPGIQFGTPARSGLFPFDCPTTMIARARRHAREAPEQLPQDRGAMVA